MRSALKLLERLLRTLLRRVYNHLLFALKGDVLKRGQELKNRYLGERVFLIANGASVRDVDLQLLKNEKLCACNLMFKHAEFSQIKWFAFFVPESGASFFTPKDSIFRKENLYPKIESEIKHPETLLFMSLNLHSYIQKAKLFLDNKLYFLKCHKQMMEYPQLSNDLAGDFTFLDGVGYTMLGAAVYMGFKEIYLCGYDYTFSPIRVGHFYDDWSELKNEPVDERHHRVKAFAEQHGVKIYNLTPDGFESPVYEKFEISRLPNLVGR